MSALDVIAAAKARLAQARAELDRALDVGADTSSAHERLERARADHAAVVAQARQEAEQVEADRLQRLQESATEAVQAAERQIAEHLASVAHVPLPAITLPVGVYVNVLDARHRAAQAAAVAAEAAAKVWHLRDRLRQLEQRSADIAARRLDGDADDRRDRGEHLLIDADSKALSARLVQAEAAAVEPARRAEEAAAAVGFAEGQWQQARHLATAQALAVACRALENALVDAAGELWSYRERCGVAPWMPVHSLKSFVTFGRPA